MEDSTSEVDNASLQPHRERLGKPVGQNIAHPIIRSSINNCGGYNTYSLLCCYQLGQSSNTVFSFFFSCDLIIDNDALTQLASSLSTNNNLSELAF